MLTYIAENLATVIVAAVIFAAAVRVAVYLIKQKKAGRHSCGGGCAGCPMAGKCNKK